MHVMDYPAAHGDTCGSFFCYCVTIFDGLPNPFTIMGTDLTLQYIFWLNIIIINYLHGTQS